MKTFITCIFCISFVSFFSGCKKDDATPSSSTFTLIDKNPSYIRAAIAGNWQVRRESEFIYWDGGSNTSETTYSLNTGNIFRFLSNDTVSILRPNNLGYFAKGKFDFIRVKNQIPNNITDSVYCLDYPDYLRIVPKEIKNDTLIFHVIYPDHIITTTYLTREK